jgi:small conductance mechanosensitive channel
MILFPLLAQAATAPADHSTIGTIVSLKDQVLGFVFQYGMDVLGAAIIVVVGLVVTAAIAQWTQQWLMRHKLEPPVRMLIVSMVKGLLWFFTAMMALDKLGVNTNHILAGAGVIGLGVGLATQGTLSNLVAGLTIIFTKPFRVGEYVEIVGVNGQVHTIDLFSTILEHPDHCRVIIPNRKIVGEILLNYGATRQLSLTVNIPAKSDIDTVLGRVREIVASNPRVLKEPAPIVAIQAIGDAAITVAILPWVPVPDMTIAQAELYQKLHEYLRAMPA